MRGYRPTCNNHASCTLIGSGHGYTSSTEGSSPRDKYDSYRADVEKGKGKDGGSDGMNGSGCGNGANGISDVRTNSTKDTAQEPAANLSVLDFEREVEMLTHLRHPNIVLFLGACRVPPNMYGPCVRWWVPSG
eukprot:scaffold5310_cov378-Prasinococcus_capsulatus_cf.AAC.15